MPKIKEKKPITYYAGYYPESERATILNFRDYLNKIEAEIVSDESNFLVFKSLEVRAQILQDCFSILKKHFRCYVAFKRSDGGPVFRRHPSLSPRRQAEAEGLNTTTKAGWDIFLDMLSSGLEKPARNPSPKE